MPNENEQYRNLMNAMASEPLDLSTVDISRAIETGKRRKRNRRISMAAAATALAVAGVLAIPFALQANARNTAELTVYTEPSASPSPSASVKPGFQTRAYPRPAAKALPTSCQGTKLPVPGGGIKSYVSNLDPSGTYVTGRVYDGEKDPVIWRNGAPTRIPFGGGDDSLQAANTKGDAVGFVYGENGPRAKAYIGGVLSELAGGVAQASGINVRGVIAGYLEETIKNDADPSGLSGGTRNVPVRWPSATAQPVRLKVPDAARTSAVATDIDEDGTIVGSINEAGDRIAYVWYPDGTAQALPTPIVNGQPARDFDARRVRNGWVTGYLTVPQKGATGVRWDLTTGKAEVLEALEWSNDISPLGWVVGMDLKSDAVLTDGVSILKLPNVFSKPADYGMNWGQAISDDGLTIAGTNDDAKNNGEQRGVVWKCH